MNADYYMSKIIEYTSTINNCCAFVGKCTSTGKCVIDEDIKECQDHIVLKKVKEALERMDDEEEE